MLPAIPLFGNNSIGDCVKMARKYYALELAHHREIPLIPLSIMVGGMSASE